ncbi:hypothetical protein [Nucisporomicrobium flavum]|uniref:hypothetical protein n=1 Tax=Nucisporomicrobium flavum TaxID=2785915 RepID=UPI0018F36E72|nr:hypothetical protein [Nucisporomicrobium flavum]
MSDDDRLLARYERMRAEIALRAVARDCATSEALADQRAAHRAETQAWLHLSELREARRAAPGDLSLVAAADQAEAAWQTARDAAEEINRKASEVARRALEESEADSRLLREMGSRVRAARFASRRPAS